MIIMGYPYCSFVADIRGGSRTAATSKVESSTLDVTAVLDAPLDIMSGILQRMY